MSFFSRIFEYYSKISRIFKAHHYNNDADKSKYDVLKHYLYDTSDGAKFKFEKIRSRNDIVFYFMKVEIGCLFQGGVFNKCSIRKTLLVLELHRYNDLKNQINSNFFESRDCDYDFCASMHDHMVDYSVNIKNCYPAILRFYVSNNNNSIYIYFYGTSEGDSIKIQLTKKDAGEISTILEDLLLT